ncbi:MAG: flagellar brake domain-containing protein [Lachnospiraceae bacterium]|nr:flagellar brake domain-containing protein [Lachnospiraceae bacterium]
MSDIRADEVLKPGERVDLEMIPAFDEAESEEEKKYYITKIYDIPDEDHVDVLMPMEKTKLMLLEVDTEFQLFFYGRKGIFACEARVSERYREEQFVVASLELTSGLKKQQRREYYRYSCVIGMNTRQLTDEEAERFEMTKDSNLFDLPEDKSVIVDISGGGIRFVTPVAYEKGKLVYCRFLLRNGDQQRTYSCVVKILNGQPVGNHTKNVEYRGEFRYLDDREREAIIHFIFEEERRMRRKG